MNEPLVMAAERYEAGCGIGDVGCMLDEQLVRTFLDIMNWVVDALAWAMNLGSVTTDSSYWSGAINMSSFWLGITSFVGVVIFGAIGVTKGVVKGERDTITRSVLGVAFSVPSTLISIWLVGYLLDALETLTAPLITAAFGGADMGEALLNYLLPNATDFLEETSAQKRGELVAEAALSSVLGMQAPFGLLLCIIVATLVVIAVNILRNILLQMLIAAAPLAFMMMPVGIGKEIIMSWAKLTAMVFIMKPMMIMFVAMMIGGMVNSGRTVWDVEGMPYAVGLLMVIVVPFAVMAMFNFFGVDTDAGGREVQQSGSRMFSFMGGSRRGISGQRQPAAPRAPRGHSSDSGQPAPASRTVQSNAGSDSSSPRPSGSDSGTSGSDSPSRGHQPNSTRPTGSEPGSGDSDSGGPRGPYTPDGLPSRRPDSNSGGTNRTPDSPRPASGNEPTGSNPPGRDLPPSSGPSNPPDNQ